MAEENNAVKQTKQPANAKPSKFKRFLNWWKRLPSRIARPFKNMWYELKKVSWPSKRKMLTCSITVLVFMLLMGLVIGFLDMGASALVKLLVV